jgi:hypothetical protein
VARLFTNNSSVNDSVKVAAQGFTAWGFGTLAAVIYNVSTTQARNWFVVGTDAQDFVELYCGATTPPDVRLWNGTASSDSTSTFANSKWYIWAETKATGNVSPRAHVFDFSTATWTHENHTGNSQDATGTGATQHGIGFDQSGNEANSPDGHCLAVAAWKSRVLTDSEFARLPAGLWDRWTPDILLEFPSGRDNLDRTTIDCSRNRMRQTVRGSQVTRTNIAGPPGFRMSALNRRR